MRAVFIELPAFERSRESYLDDDGFIPSAGNTKLVGKVLLAHNWSILPGYVTYGINFQG